MMRPDAMALVYQIACRVLGTTYCFVTVQTDPSKLPAVVFYAVGQDTLTTLDTGPQQRGTAIRFEVRADRDSGGFAATARLSTRMVAALRQSGRLVSLLSLVDDFDETLGIYRRIRSVMVE